MKPKSNRDEGEYEYCPDKGKRIFLTKGGAERAARDIRRKRKGVCSVYQCNHCGHFHTTSMSYQQSKNIRQGFTPHANELYEI